MVGWHAESRNASSTDLSEMNYSDIDRCATAGYVYSHLGEFCFGGLVMVGHGALIAALAALTMAAGLSGEPAVESCAVLDAQVQQIKTITSEAVLRAKLAELKATDPECELMQVLMARLVELQSLKLPTAEMTWVAY